VELKYSIYTRSFRLQNKFGMYISSVHDSSFELYCRILISIDYMLKNISCKAYSYSAVEEISYFSRVLNFISVFKKEIPNFDTVLNQLNPGSDLLVYDTV
jgi:hypothetical protein